ncbi:C-GCAxxG-C-C family protein [Maridesulfovibrio zosterae]|uniref:C-GCAxxG-C-C family protein n=1 Tax=Maridesulfovibrio zosterae TaxID=82171 RepID=UPI000416CBC9|nr:C-GCAxxG-C-C family protein [Maridesulfovibrio zosterae]
MSGNKARQRFANEYFCAESVLMTICETIGYENQAIPAMATAFCGGVSRTKGTCGALQGAVLAISLIHGRNNTDQNYDKCYELVQILSKNFQEKYSSTNCFEITDCDLSIQQGREKFKEEGVKHNICLNIVEEITDYTIMLLMDNQVK